MKWLDRKQGPQSKCTVFGKKLLAKAVVLKYLELSASVRTELAQHVLVKSSVRPDPTGTSSAHVSITRWPLAQQ